MEYAIAVKTDVGPERTKNQDSLYVRTASLGEKNYALAVVCDGMGGLSEGEYASRLVVEALSAWFESSFAGWLNGGSREDALCIVWKKLLDQCNAELLRYGEKKGIQSGTTATALLLGPERFALVHIGDTRAYVIGDGLCQMTRDHTLAMQKVENGTLSLEEAAHSRENHVLTRCIGVEDEINPDFSFGEVKDNAVYLLCSDGFRNHLSEQELKERFRPEFNSNAKELLGSCEYLLKTGVDRGESDNLSVIAIRAMSAQTDLVSATDEQKTILLD